MQEILVLDIADLAGIVMQKWYHCNTWNIVYFISLTKKEKKKNLHHTNSEVR